MNNRLGFDKFMIEANRRLALLNEKKKGHDVIGIEIKKKRKDQKLTLEAVSNKICSQSYLSKVENGKIKINRAILEEICERQELTKKDLEKLLESKDILISSINAYIYDKPEIIKNNFNEFKYSNYRKDILSLIYYVSNNNYSIAFDIYNQILDYISSLSEFDFIVYSIISAFFMIRKYRFIEAIDLVKNLDKYLLTEELRIARLYVLFEANYGLNNPSTIFYFNELENYSIKTLNVDFLEKNRYFICIYYLKNKSFDSYKRTLKGINNNKYITSLDVINCFFNKNYDDINSSYDNLTDYAKMLRYIVYNRNYYLQSINFQKEIYFNMDYDPLYVDYFSNRNPLDKANYIFDRVIPILIYSNDNYLKNYFIEELAYMDNPRKASNVIKYLNYFRTDKIDIE